MRPYDDSELRARFGALRAARDAAAPPLDRVLAAARTRRHAARAAARRRLRYAVAAALPLGGALTAYALERAAAREQARLIDQMELLAHWRSPTDYLLVDRSLGWLSAGSTLESAIDLAESVSPGGRP